MHLILVRHAETAHNRDGLVQGRADHPLSDLGTRQAAALGARLAGRTLDAVYSSPLGRATATARAIAEPQGLTVVLVGGLVEMDIGEMEGLTGAELRQRHPEFLREWASDAAAEAVMPGGESLVQVQQRAATALDQILGLHAEGTVAVVTHNFVLLTLLCRLLSLPLKEFRRLRHYVAATSIIEIAAGRTTIVSLNDVCHLEQAGLLGGDPWQGRR